MMTTQPTHSTEYGNGSSKHELMPQGVVDIATIVKVDVDPDALTSDTLEEWLIEVANQPRWRLEAEKCDAYYEGKQLDAEILQLMEERGQAPIVENHIQPIVNQMLGMQAKARLDTKVAPEAGETNTDVAEALSVKLKHAATMANAARAKSDAYADMIKGGFGCIEVSRPTDPFKPPYRFDKVPRRECFWDWRAKKADLSDARYFIRKQWKDVDALKKVWPQHSEFFRHAMSGRMNWDSYIEVNDSLSTGQVDDYAASWNMSSEQYEWMSTTRKRILLYEVWYRTHTTSRVVKLPNGRVVEYDENNLQMSIAALSGMLQPYDANFDKVRVAYFAGPKLLEDKPSPYKHRHFPYVPFFGYREEKTGIPYGVVRSMLTKQDEINTHLTKMMWAINSRWVEASEDSVFDHDAIRNEIAAPDAYIITKRGTNTAQTGERFVIHENQQIASQQFQFYQAAKESLQAIAGVHNATLGRESGATSGLAINSLVEQDSITQAEINDNYNMSARHADELLLSLVIEDLSDTNDERVTVEDDFGVKREIVLNIPSTDPVTGKPYIENDVTKVNVSVVLEDTPTTPTFRNQQLNQLSDVVKTLPPTAQAVLIPDLLLATELPKRQEMAKKVAASMGLQSFGTDEDPMLAQLKAENDQLKAELEKKQPQAVTDATVQKILAEVESIKAKTTNVDINSLFSAMQAAGLVVQSPGIVPVADSLAKSAGFADKDGGTLAQIPEQAMPVDMVVNMPRNTSPQFPADPASPDAGINAGIETVRNEGVQARAAGGPVAAGKPYLVGEQGPELIVPQDNGYVLNNNQTVQAFGNGLQGAPMPTSDNPDYDMAGYERKYGKPDQSNGQHLTDEFKLPNHVTFSDQSQYSSEKLAGGTWKEGGAGRYVFTPSEQNLRLFSPEDYANYFSKYERKGTFVQLPDGRLVEGSK